jgi:predicted RNase H-like HicB family nuclease
MVIKYIEKAMRHAAIEKMEDGRYFGSIPGLNGVWADGDTKDECLTTLEEVLEDWLVLSLRDDDELPEFDGITLNFGGKRWSAQSSAANSSED